MAAAMVTFGHGRLDSEQLQSLLTGAGIEGVVDVRRFPGSRHNAAAASGAIETLTAGMSVSYRWDSRLGGRRRLNAAEDATAQDGWWKVAAFRAYAAWTRSEEFRGGLTDLVAELAQRRTAIMCSEAVWWRCHRRLISDVVVLEHDLPVEHLMHDARLTAHPASDGARLGPTGRVVWDGARDQPSPGGK